MQVPASLPVSALYPRQSGCVPGDRKEGQEQQWWAEEDKTTGAGDLCWQRPRVWWGVLAAEFTAMCRWSQLLSWTLKHAGNTRNQI